MSTARPGPWWPRLIAVMLCLIATAAVLIAIPTRSWRQDAPRTEDPLAPGLAALTDEQLAELLPKQTEFPASWTVKAEKYYDRFGYSRQQVFRDPFPTVPPECVNLNERIVGAASAADVAGHDVADRSGAVSNRQDIRLTIGREFDRGGFDVMINRVSQCSQFTTARMFISRTRIMEDSRPANGPQRFRIAVTEASLRETRSATRTEYFSYARTSRLVLIGYASTGNQQLLDTLFDNTLRRISAP